MSQPKVAEYVLHRLASLGTSTSDDASVSIDVYVGSIGNLHRRNLDEESGDL